MTSAGERGSASRPRRQAFAFAHGVVRAELDQIRRRPFSMPSGWLVLALTAVIAIAIVSAARHDWHDWGPVHAAVVYVLAVLAGLAASVGLLALAQLLEALRFATANHAYLIQSAHGESGAYVSRELGGRLTLSSLWAWPRGRGLGTQVLQLACRDAEDDGSQLWLVAGNRGLVRYYERQGFRRLRRVLMGHLMVHDPTFISEESVQHDADAAYGDS